MIVFCTRAAGTLSCSRIMMPGWWILVRWIMGNIPLHHVAPVTLLWTQCIKLTENRTVKEKTLVVSDGTRQIMRAYNRSRGSTHTHSQSILIYKHNIQVSTEAYIIITSLSFGNDWQCPEATGSLIKRFSFLVDEC